jgi:hypothetical protein
LAAHQLFHQVRARDCVKSRLVYVDAPSQGGSSGWALQQECIQGSRAAIRWLTRPSCVRVAEIYLFGLPKSISRGMPSGFKSTQALSISERHQSATVSCGRQSDEKHIGMCYPSLPDTSRPIALAAEREGRYLEYRMKTESQRLPCHRWMSNVLTKLCTRVDESTTRVGPKSLTLSTELCRLHVLSKPAPSSNGKTADSGQSSGFRVLRALLPLPPSVDKIVC